MPTAIAAMSGGVDSAVAAALLLDKYRDCTGVTLKLFGETNFTDARQVAEKLNIPHRILDFSEEFRCHVIRRFIKTYEEGATPNPCVDCNRDIKFAFPLYLAHGLDFDLFCTGHYAQIEPSGSRRLLKKAADRKKDQSYVLYSLTQAQLERCFFPLGNLSKSEVRKIAEELKFVNAEKEESQDICFVPDGDYGAFMEQYDGKSYPQGDILDLEGKVLGRHKGHVRYTLGQRRGLGVALNDPAYVCAKDPLRNTITLGSESSLYSKTLVADRINLIACESMEKPMRVKVKTRYLQTESPATAIQSGEDEIRIEFDEGQRALTPGQSAVLYDGDYVVGGGIIRSVFIDNGRREHCLLL